MGWPMDLRDGLGAAEWPGPGLGGISPRAGGLPLAQWPGAVAEALTRAGVPSETGSPVVRDLLAAIAEPAAMAAVLAREFPAMPWSMIHGPIDQRILLLPATGTTSAKGEWILCSLGRPLGQCAFPVRSGDELHIEDAAGQVSAARLSEPLLRRMSLPRVKLVALYYPEVFPLPRLALSISDLANALRNQMIGQVSMEDMQLSRTLDDIVDGIRRERPDIVGISATFGQQSLVEELLDRLVALGPEGYAPRLVVGGSLCALNADFLVGRFPQLVVAMGPGERTICDLVRHHCGEIPLDQVSDLLFRDGTGEIRRTNKLSHHDRDDTLPELDLLDATLAHNGVLQLETSRGCTHACAFCPRDHKGKWKGYAPDSLDTLLPFVAQAYGRQAAISKRIFFVDEEFIGHPNGMDALPRCLDVARKMAAHGFRFETSARVDQVYHPERTPQWHVERMRFWKELSRTALDRCLFGVESGVDSVLRRFNKRTTPDQNVHAIRILSACDIPRRCTYITFDPLMDMRELIDSYRFQGRRDLLLRPLPDMREEELFEGIHDDGFVAHHSPDRPFYNEISYMLVTMECLMNSPYSRQVEASGLLRQVNLSMGRWETDFRDPAIQLMSYYSQCWIDRNFSFDYTLKSVEKITGTDVRARIRSFRTLFREKAYQLLGMMLALANGDLGLLSDAGLAAHLTDLSARWNARADRMGENGLLIEELMNRHFSALRTLAAARFDEIRGLCAAQHLSLIEREMEVWQRRTDWGLINAASAEAPARPRDTDKH
ncbi:MAG TPA: radical SAM protein [Magnetospirillum sp.]|nr:radical SAM protein [Magnetospirillum sp.]